MHNEGRIFGYQHAKRLAQFVTSRNGISDVHGFIELEKQFCLDAIDDIRLFVHSLNEELANLCERTKASAR